MDKKMEKIVKRFNAGMPFKNCSWKDIEMLEEYYEAELEREKQATAKEIFDTIDYLGLSKIDYPLLPIDLAKLKPLMKKYKYENTSC